MHCNWCNSNTPSISCSNCKSKFYCNKECQLMDWKQGSHKSDCVEFNNFISSDINEDVKGNSELINLSKYEEGLELPVKEDGSFVSIFKTKAKFLSGNRIALGLDGIYISYELDNEIDSLIQKISKYEHLYTKLYSKDKKVYIEKTFKNSTLYNTIKDTHNKFFDSSTNGTYYVLEKGSNSVDVFTLLKNTRSRFLEFLESLADEYIEKGDPLIYSNFDIIGEKYDAHLEHGASINYDYEITKKKKRLISTRNTGSKLFSFKVAKLVAFISSKIWVEDETLLKNNKAIIYGLSEGIYTNYISLKIRFGDDNSQLIDGDTLFYNLVDEFINSLISDIFIIRGSTIYYNGKKPIKADDYRKMVLHEIIYDAFFSDAFKTEEDLTDKIRTEIENKKEIIKGIKRSSIEKLKRDSLESTKDNPIFDISNETSQLSETTTIPKEKQEETREPLKKDEDQDDEEKEVDKYIAFINERNELIDKHYDNMISQMKSGENFVTEIIPRANELIPGMRDDYTFALEFVNEIRILYRPVLNFRGNDDEALFIHKLLKKVPFSVIRAAYQSEVKKFTKFFEFSRPLLLGGEPNPLIFDNYSNIKYTYEDFIRYHTDVDDNIVLLIKWVQEVDNKIKENLIESKFDEYQPKKISMYVEDTVDITRIPNALKIIKEEYGITTILELFERKEEIMDVFNDNNFDTFMRNAQIDIMNQLELTSVYYEKYISERTGTKSDGEEFEEEDDEDEDLDFIDGDDDEVEDDDDDEDDYDNTQEQVDEDDENDDDNTQEEIDEFETE